MIVAVIGASYAYSFAEVLKYYGIPWLLVTHWCECTCSILAIHTLSAVHIVLYFIPFRPPAPFRPPFSP